eukprot:jgi/Mesvir1/5682/Mv25100-RA.2
MCWVGRWRPMPCLFLIPCTWGGGRGGGSLHHTQVGELPLACMELGGILFTTRRPSPTRHPFTHTPGLAPLCLSRSPGVAAAALHAIRFFTTQSPQAHTSVLGWLGANIGLMAHEDLQAAVVAMLGCLSGAEPALLPVARKAMRQAALACWGDASPQERATCTCPGGAAGATCSAGGKSPCAGCQNQPNRHSSRVHAQQDKASNQQQGGASKQASSSSSTVMPSSSTGPRLAAPHAPPSSGGHVALKLQLLAASMRLVMGSGDARTRQLASRVLRMAKGDDSFDVRDAARVAHRLLRLSSATAATTTGATAATTTPATTTAAIPSPASVTATLGTTPAATRAAEAAAPAATTAVVEVAAAAAAAAGGTDATGGICQGGAQEGAAKTADIIELVRRCMVPPAMPLLDHPSIRHRLHGCRPHDPAPRENRPIDHKPINHKPLEHKPPAGGTQSMQGASATASSLPPGGAPASAASPPPPATASSLEASDKRGPSSGCATSTPSSTTTRGDMRAETGAVAASAAHGTGPAAGAENGADAPAGAEGGFPLGSLALLLDQPTRGYAALGPLLSVGSLGLSLDPQVRSPSTEPPRYLTPLAANMRAAAPTPPPASPHRDAAPWPAGMGARGPEPRAQYPHQALPGEGHPGHLNHGQSSQGPTPFPAPSLARYPAPYLSPFPAPAHSGSPHFVPSSNNAGHQVAHAPVAHAHQVAYGHESAHHVAGGHTGSGASVGPPPWSGQGRGGSIRGPEHGLQEALAERAPVPSASIYWTNTASQAVVERAGAEHAELQTGQAGHRYRAEAAGMLSQGQSRSSVDGSPSTFAQPAHLYGNGQLHAGPPTDGLRSAGGDCGHGGDMQYQSPSWLTERVRVLGLEGQLGSPHSQAANLERFLEQDDSSGDGSGMASARAVAAGRYSAPLPVSFASQHSVVSPSNQGNFPTVTNKDSPDLTAHGLDLLRAEASYELARGSVAAGPYGNLAEQRPTGASNRREPEQEGNLSQPVVMHL